MVKLPLEFEMVSTPYKAHAVQPSDFDFYRGVYSNERLMKYIHDDIDLPAIAENFQTLLAEARETQPQFINYVMDHRQQRIGFLGVKLHPNLTLEMGLVLVEAQQGQGWSKVIKMAFIQHAIKHWGIQRFWAYCKQDNAVANHIFQSLSFVLEKQFINQRKQHLMNKWVLSVNELRGNMT